MISIHRLAQLVWFVVVCELLFVVACVMSSAIHQALTPNDQACYMFWFGISLYPLALYLRHRQVIQFDNRDLMFILLVLVLYTLYFHVWGDSWEAKIIGFILFGVWIRYGLRRSTSAGSHSQ